MSHGFRNINELDGEAKVSEASDSSFRDDARGLRSTKELIFASFARLSPATEDRALASAPLKPL